MGNTATNLIEQIEKIAKHSRQHSIKTKEKYLQANKQFCRYIGEKFGTQKFSNIKNKHLEDYVEHMKEKGVSASTIKTSLSAIRFFHELSGSKNLLKNNEAFELQKRCFGGVNRTWSYTEYNSFKTLAEQRRKAKFADIATLGRNEGLRLHECKRTNKRICKNPSQGAKLTT